MVFSSVVRRMTVAIAAAVMLLSASAPYALLVNAAPSDILLDDADIGGDLSRSDLDTIMSLVSIAENSNTEWWTNYNYCEDIGDGRGFTVSLVGFCSGTGDLVEVLKDVKATEPSNPLADYIPAMEKLDGSDSHEGIEDLCSTIESNGNDAWKNAVWKGIKRDYLDTALTWAEDHGLTSVFSKGFLFDVSLNHGPSGMDQIAGYAADGTAPPSEGGEEVAYMQAFIQARIHVVQEVDASTNSGQDDRMVMWKSLLDDGNLGLTGTMELECYGESFTLTRDDSANDADPETLAPDTPEPETSAPEISEPETSEPELPEPETSEPKVPEPETPPTKPGCKLALRKRD